MKPISEFIKDILSAFEKSDQKILNYKQVAGILNITQVDEKNLLEKIMADMSFKGQLIEVAHGKYKTKEESLVYTGKLDLTKTGSGYVTVEGFENDIYIPARATNGAFHGDKVEVAIPKSSLGKDRIEGKINKVLERSKTEVVGVIELSKKFAFLIPDDTRFAKDVFIPLNMLGGAINGQKVLAKIKEWPADPDESPVGEVIEILGTPGETNTEIHAILAEFGLPRGFPMELEKEGEKIPTHISEEEIKKRRDFRKITTITIDPFDAKDFDDALSYQELPNGNVEIGVHIADVSHYVKEGSLIDQEAVQRATSIYLVDRVVPMLPEILSNNVCSLRPNEDKLCFAAVFELNQAGEILNEWFGRTIIHSIRRFTYEEVQEIIVQQKGELSGPILQMDKLAKILRKKRMAAGAIAFEKEEVKFKLNSQKEPVEVIFKRQLDAHKLIEEFMLLANRKVSEFVGKAKKDAKGQAFIYRIHDVPNKEKLEEFSEFVKTFGYKFNSNHHKDVSTSINNLLVDVKGKKEEHLISTLAIRTMAKAVYSMHNIGHYGLAFDYYSHFTSPIRRYPDMIAHRLLQEYLTTGKTVVKESDFEQLCKHCSSQEKLAEEAERASIKYMQVQYLKDKIGNVFKGVVSGMTERGLFIEIIENKCEGMIKLRDISGDFYELEAKKHRVVGKRTRKVIQLGDEMWVKVKNIDIPKKLIDLEWVDPKKMEKQ